MRFDGIATEKQRMGYTSAGSRPACQNCAHARRVTPTGASNDVHSLRCDSGGFGTTAMAVCARHQYPAPKPRAQAPVSP